MNIMEMSSSAAILVLVIIVIRALAMHKLPKRAFMILWAVAGLRLLLPLQISSPLSVFSIMNLFAKAETGLTSEAGLNVPIKTIEVAKETITGFIGQPNTQITPLIIVWIVGMAACLIFFGVAYFRCRKEFASSLPVQNDFVSEWLDSHKTARQLQIRQSDKIMAPLTYGVFRPIILLPKTTEWENMKQLKYVLTHEFVHIQRFDVLYKLVLVLCVCIHWFNPFVWIMYVLANRDIELACDEQVVRIFGETTKSFYALTLIGMEEKKSRLTPLCNNFSKNSIEERIRSIMKLKKTSIVGLVAATLLVAGTTTVFATSEEGNNNKPEENIKISDVALFFTDDGIGKRVISIDNGNTWMGEDEYQETNPTPDVVWWTYDEYKEWMEQDIKVLQSLVETEDAGYYDKNNEFQNFTQKDVDEAIANHNATLENIKNGIKVSKTVNGQNDIVLSYNPDDAMTVQPSYVMTIMNDDSEQIIFGPYDTKEELLNELKPYCDQQVEAGAMTQDEADTIIQNAIK